MKALLLLAAILIGLLAWPRTDLPDNKTCVWETGQCR